MTKRPLILLAAAAMAIAPSAGGSASTLGKVKDVFRTATIGPKGDTGGEPSIAAARDGSLYVSYPASSSDPKLPNGATFFRSTNSGKTWVQGAMASEPGDSGDTTVNVDSSGAVYESNLRYVHAQGLQVDVYKSLDRGAHWFQKGVMAPSTTGPVDDAVYGPSSSNSRFLVDRQWTDAYIPAGKTSKDARVYITYHDFVAGVVWVNVSIDGGKTFSQQTNIIKDPAALANSACNVVPGPIKVVQSGPHAGRVYVVWLAGAAGENVPTGCNYTMLATFGQIWSAYSDDEGKSWTDRLVYDSGTFSAGDGLGLVSIGHDASTLFADLALDTEGNPYVVFSLNAAPPPHTGGPGDQWDVYVEASFDGGQTWNGASDGTGAPYQVTSTPGTHIFAAITAGDPGRVAVAYLGTDSIVPQLPYGKPRVGGDPNAKWNVFMARSLDVRAVGHPSWTIDQVTTKPVHTGDICTLGIFCLPVVSNRDILDFIDVVGDPSGMVHISYTDTENSSGGTIVAGNQIAGTPLRVRKIIHKPKVKVPKPRKIRVLGERLPGTGVRDAPVAGVLLVAIAAMLGRRLRRPA